MFRLIERPHLAAANEQQSSGEDRSHSALTQDGVQRSVRIPNVRIAEDTPPNVFESKEQSIQYERWCAFLKQRMEQAAASAQCLECESDQEKGLVSEKNVLLTAVRRRVAGEDGIEVE